MRSTSLRGRLLALHIGHLQLQIRSAYMCDPSKMKQTYTELLGSTVQSNLLTLMHVHQDLHKHNLGNDLTQYVYIDHLSRPQASHLPSERQNLSNHRKRGRSLLQDILFCRTCRMHCHKNTAHAIAIQNIQSRN